MIALPDACNPAIVRDDQRGGIVERLLLESFHRAASRDPLGIAIGRTSKLFRREIGLRFFAQSVQRLARPALAGDRHELKTAGRFELMSVNPAKLSNPF